MELLMAGRIGGLKTRNSGRWTDAMFKSFIRGNLRRITSRWGPIGDCLKNARTRRGFYICNSCKEEVPASTRDENNKRVKNAVVDHIVPVIDPNVGWVSWDDTIERMFSELDNLQVLCCACHKIKTDEEKGKAKIRRQNEKEIFDE
jgi:5-methylcytosine-specific restriction endonuclease McrA